VLPGSDHADLDAGGGVGEHGMSRDYPNYYGLPVTLASEDPRAMSDYHKSPSRGEYDVGRFALRVKILDSDPFYGALIYQHDVPIAIVECLSGKEGIVQGLKLESPGRLREVFRIEC
jgi:hypothetical protein